MDLIVKKVTALPATYTPNTLYFVAAAAASEVDLYISNNAGTAVRRINTSADIVALIANNPPGMGVTVAECTW